MVDLSTIGQLYAGVLCPQCRRSGLELCHNGAKDQALAVYLELWCSVYEMNISTGYTSKRVNGQQAFEMNRKAVLTGLTVGLGHFGLAKISEGLGMPSMHHKSHSRHMDVITRVVPLSKPTSWNKLAKKYGSTMSFLIRMLLGRMVFSTLASAMMGAGPKEGTHPRLELESSSI